MTQINLPNRNVTGDNLWSQVEDNDDAIIDTVNGDLDDGNIAVGADIDGSKLLAASVGTTQLEAGSVDTTQLASNAVTTAKIDTGAVDTTQLASNAVTKSKIAESTLQEKQVLIITASGNSVISWDTAFASANYSVALGLQMSNGHSPGADVRVWFDNKTTTGITLFWDDSNAGSGRVLSVNMIALAS
jgi:hypothetical protein